MRTILLILAVAAIMVGCGEKSDEDQIRDQAVGYVENLRDGDIAGACERTVDPQDCIATIRAAELLVGGREELLVAIGVSDETVRRAQDAPIRVEGDTGGIEGRRGDMEVRRVDGEWRIVLPEFPSD